MTVTADRRPSGRRVPTSPGPAIFEEAYELILLLYPYVQGFPKSQRFVLGQRMEHTAVSVLAGIVQANASRDKVEALSAVSVELEKLRVFTRLAKDLRFLDLKKYERLSERIDVVGRMLGGWLKWARGRSGEKR